MSSTIRQQIAVQILSEIIRNSNGKKSISMGTILREAGYSKQTSLKPKLVTETKGFKEEMNRVISDLKLVKTHAELLDAYELKTMSFDGRLSDKEIKEIIEDTGKYKIWDISRKNHEVRCRYWAPDYQARLKALDLAYKLKNHYPKKGQLVDEKPMVVQVVNYHK